MTQHRPILRTLIAAERRKLDELARRIEDTKDLETQADLVKYFCVRVVGFLERTCQEAGSSVVHRMAGAQAARFASSHLRKSFNPKPGRITEFAARFDVDWSQRLETFLVDDERGTRLGALVGIRNAIAHGKDQGIGSQNAFAYRALVDELVDELAAHFEPST